MTEQELRDEYNRLWKEANRIGRYLPSKNPSLYGDDNPDYKALTDKAELIRIELKKFKVYHNEADPYRSYDRYLNCMGRY